MIKKLMAMLLMASTMLFGVLPAEAGTWWNPDWAYRKQITVDTTATGANLAADVKPGVVLVRLHTGNFGYFLDVAAQAKDLRFIAGDDKTPLKFHVERFDQINEMGLIWVQLPEVKANDKSLTFYMYYGNQGAKPAGDPAGTFPDTTVLVDHFDNEGGMPTDATAYGNNVTVSTAEVLAASVSGQGAALKVDQGMTIPASPSLQFGAQKGWTFSLWVHADKTMKSGPVLRVGDAGGANVSLEFNDMKPGVVLKNSSGSKREVTGANPLQPETWHHLAVIGQGGEMTLYVDGEAAGTASATLPDLQGPVVIGHGDGSRGGFAGGIDELRLSNVALSADALKLQVKGEGPGGKLLAYGDDGKKDAEESGSSSYFMVTLHNVTLDGWVVIFVLSIMAAISWVVMISKGLVIQRTSKENLLFQRKFLALQSATIDELDNDEEDDPQDSDVMLAFGGDQGEFKSSNIYRLYHVGIKELHKRMAHSVGAEAVDLTLSPQAVDAIRVTMDGAMTRESQRLNSQMVLLTIAISGGPFLGLLGTVVGVMITFAAIAATGDVNVNSIAPGIAAALVATVAGLGVAIPALFGYNYLSTRIKEITADMRVFIDEFVAKIAEMHS